MRTSLDEHLSFARERGLMRLIDKYPLLIVFGSAILLRVVAALFSQGYMASDDHFETVKIAFEWLQNGGPLNSAGFLTWHTTPIGGVSRFPLYTLSLYGVFVVERWLGLTSLEQMMYGMRFLHVGFSLVAVWAVYRTVELVTKSTRWAALGGTLVSAHFLLPYLSARNLIEMVGGNILIVAIYFLYRWRDTHIRGQFGFNAHKLLFLAGVVSGLAWMVRFEIALAVAPIPFILFYQSRRLQPALWYSAGVSLMILLAGAIDYALIGSFLASTLNHLSQVQSEGVVYGTSLFIYLTVITIFLIPPFAFVIYWLWLRRDFCREHTILIFSSLSFVTLHMLALSRQERYMIPLIPVLLLLVTLSLWRRYKMQGYILKNRALFKGVCAIAIVINVVFLALFTVHYGHRGLVEPFVRLEKLGQSGRGDRALIVSPSFGTLFPLEYSANIGAYLGTELSSSNGNKNGIKARYVFSWSELAELRADTLWVDSVDYLLVYPGDAAALARTLDSLGLPPGKLTEMFHVEPSLIGRLLHRLNPRHNPTYEVWVYACD